MIDSQRFHGAAQAGQHTTQKEGKQLAAADIQAGEAGEPFIHTNDACFIAL